MVAEVVKEAGEEQVFRVTDDDGRQLVVLLAEGVERCSACRHQPCEHTLLVQSRSKEEPWVS